MESNMDIRELMERFYSGEGRTFTPINPQQDDYGLFFDPNLRHLASRLYKSQFEPEKTKEETENKDI